MPCKYNVDLKDKNKENRLTPPQYINKEQANARIKLKLIEGNSKPCEEEYKNELETLWNDLREVNIFQLNMLLGINKKAQIKSEKYFNANKVNIDTLQVVANKHKIRHNKNRNEKNNMLDYVFYLEDS